MSEIVYGKEKIKISALEYGVKNEENALKSFYAAQVKAHQNLKVEKTGLFIHKTKPFIAASLDGIMTCKFHDIKCPKTLGGMEINSSTAKKCPFLKVTKDEIKLNRSHKYYTCLLYTSPSPRDKRQSRMPSSA